MPLSDVVEPVNEPVVDPASKTGGRYAHYVLAVLVLGYIFNFIDRNILSILAEDIKADLGIDDAQMGFLYGTVFAVFYAVFGIPLARFADVLTRRSLVSVGLAFWSLMTAASGLARSFGVLAACRIGVGIGEASASPAAYSMLSDYYSPRLRATVIAIYAAGVYIGAGIGGFGDGLNAFFARVQLAQNIGASAGLFVKLIFDALAQAGKRILTLAELILIELEALWISVF